MPMSLKDRVNTNLPSSGKRSDTIVDGQVTRAPWRCTHWTSVWASESYRISLTVGGIPLCYIYALR